jgi:hypothetical protein
MEAFEACSAAFSRGIQIQDGVNLWKIAEGPNPPAGSIGNYSPIVGPIS